MRRAAVIRSISRSSSGTSRPVTMNTMPFSRNVKVSHTARPVSRVSGPAIFQIRRPR